MGFSTRNYILIVSDLIETNNSRNTNYGYGSDQTGDTEQDQVSGYTIQQIEGVFGRYIFMGRLEKPTF